MHSAEQAREWLTLLRTTLRQLGVVRREHGGGLAALRRQRLDPAGRARRELGTKTELKNMNSFRFVERGINAEIARQTALLQAGEPVVQETLHFDPRVGRDHVAALQGGGARLPLLPRARPRPARDRRRDARGRARRDARAAGRSAPRATRPSWGSSGRQARLLAFRGELGGFFEAALAAGGRAAVDVANWVEQLAARVGERPGRVEGRARPRWPRWRRWPPSARSPPAPRARCSTRSWPTAATPRRSSRPRASARSAATTSCGRSSQEALAANPDAAEKIRAATMKAIGADHRPRHAARPRAAPTARRSRGSSASSSASETGVARQARRSSTRGPDSG